MTVIDHLTLTGPEAGQTFCGAPREEGKHYAHLPYASKAKMDWFVENILCCEKCREVYYQS